MLLGDTAGNADVLLTTLLLPLSDVLWPLVTGLKLLVLLSTEAPVLLGDTVGNADVLLTILQCELLLLLSEVL